VTSFTWQRDSHGLFDYECKSLTKKVLKVQHTGKHRAFSKLMMIGSIKRIGSDIGFSKDNVKSKIASPFNYLRKRPLNRMKMSYLN